jgi:hypothetical protein
MNRSSSKNIIGMSHILYSGTNDHLNLDLDKIEAEIANNNSAPKKTDEYDSYIKKLSAEIEDINKQFDITPGENNNFLDSQNIRESSDNILPKYNLSSDVRSVVSNKSNRSNHSHKSARSDRSRRSRRSDRSRRSERSNHSRHRAIKKAYDDRIDSEDDDDEMVRIIEQIDMLRSTLTSEGIDVSRIPDAGPTTSRKEAKKILKILKIKNDRARSMDFINECFMTVAYLLEQFFDGEREILGKKIDLTGYSDTVKIKLRRMQYDTSIFVSDVMKGYHITSGWRIMFELVPSLIMYSRDRKIKANDTLVSDEDYKKALQGLPIN